VPDPVQSVACPIITVRIDPSKAPPGVALCDCIAITLMAELRKALASMPAELPELVVSLSVLPMQALVEAQQAAEMAIAQIERPAKLDG
jgi:hypothetical protein